MNVYIWQRLDRVSGNYHEEGGLVIVAASLRRCKELAADDKDIRIDKPPTRVIPCGPDEAEALYVFPDAGCC